MDIHTPVFNFFSPHRLVFGPGQIHTLSDLAAPMGKRFILVTGKSSFLKTDTWLFLEKRFLDQGFSIHQASITTEPSPKEIDSIVHQFKEQEIDMVIGIGGGSVLDGGKAVSAMMTQNGSVMDFLEGVGNRSHTGEKLPFIAVPTTSGTGSEATKNAVISRPGEKGFKKSLRHNNFIPDIALVDPKLTLTCPAPITAACGMDALTQLMEAYVSTQASPMTDALCISGLEGFGRALTTAVETDPDNLEARTRLSYGSYLSGLALANAGLGVVHGFASTIGGISPISHGNVCGTLLAETTKANIEALRASDSTHPGLDKYARISVLLGLSSSSQPADTSCNRLMEGLFQWTDQFKMPRLGECNIRREQLESIAQNTGLKNNPIHLSKQALEDILLKRI